MTFLLYTCGRIRKMELVFFLFIIWSITNIFSVPFSKAITSWIWILVKSISSVANSSTVYGKSINQINTSALIIICIRPQNGQAHFKDLAANAAWFLKCVYLTIFGAFKELLKNFQLYIYIYIIIYILLYIYIYIYTRPFNLSLNFQHK